MQLSQYIIYGWPDGKEAIQPRDLHHPANARIIGWGNYEECGPSGRKPFVDQQERAQPGAINIGNPAEIYDQGTRVSACKGQGVLELRRGIKVYLTANGYDGITVLFRRRDLDLRVPRVSHIRAIPIGQAC